jgi:hypothetical protein
MIKNSKGEKCTPKQLAKDLVAGAVKDVAAAKAACASDMTDKELAIVQEQVDKVRGRVLKILGEQAE